MPVLIYCPEIDVTVGNFLKHVQSESTLSDTTCPVDSDDGGIVGSPRGNMRPPLSAPHDSTSSAFLK